MDIKDIHVHDSPGRTLCDRSGPSISRTEALDPDDGKVFTCGDCLLVLSGGVEPMGGSAP